MSIRMERPTPLSGKDLFGFRRVVILVRDIDAEFISYALDSAALASCPDDARLADGISDSCVLDTTSWVTSHTLRVTVHFTDGGSADYEFRYL